MDVVNWTIAMQSNSSWDNDTVGSMSPYQLYWTYLPEIYIVKAICIPFWMLIGIPGNVLACLVWNQPSMRASSGTILAALAVTDLIFLLLRFLYELQETWRHNTLEVPVLCQSFPVVFLAVQYLSMLLVLGLTVQRYIAVCHPFHESVRRRSIRRTVILIAIMAALSLGLTVIHAYFWYFDHDSDTCSPRPAVIEGGAYSLWSIWSWVTEMLVFGAVPIAILGLNFFVIVEIGRINRRHLESIRGMQLKPSSQAANNNNDTTANQNHQRRRNHSNNGPAATTVMLLAVSFYLIVVTLPVTLCYVLYSLYPEGDFTLTRDQVFDDPTWQAHFRYWAVRSVVQEIGMSHFACNFYIYLATGEMFRSELGRVFGGWCSCCGRVTERAKRLSSRRKSSETNAAAEVKVDNGNGSTYHALLRMSSVNTESVNGSQD